MKPFWFVLAITLFPIPSLAQEIIVTNKGGGMACAEKEDLERAYEYAREGKTSAFKHLHQSGRCFTLLKGLSGRIRNYSIFGVSEIELRGLGNSGPLPVFTGNDNFHLAPK